MKSWICHVKVYVNSVHVIFPNESKQSTKTSLVIFQRMWPPALPSACLSTKLDLLQQDGHPTRHVPLFSLCPSFQGSPTKKLAKEGGPPSKLSRGLSPLPLSFGEKEKKPQIRACVSRPKIEGPPIPTYWASVHQVLLQLLSGEVTIKFSTIITSNLQFETNCDEF